VVSTIWLCMLWMPVLLGTALAAGQSGTRQGVVQAATAGTCDWTGNWDAHWLTGDATMSLTQDGATVTGGYAYNQGTITGTVLGGTLSGQWSEAGSGTAAAAGAFQFTAAPDCDSFTGQWREDGTGPWQVWNGSRAAKERAEWTLPAGWNLVSSVDGATFSTTPAELLTLRPGDGGAYESVDPNRPLNAGWGYWAYFARSTIFSAPKSTGRPYQVTAPAGEWVMLGNPDGLLPALVDGADLVYSFDPGQGYLSGRLILPGRAVFAVSLSGGTMDVRLTSPAGPPPPPP
jgi:hypothetical protein